MVFLFILELEEEGSVLVYLLEMEVLGGREVGVLEIFSGLFYVFEGFFNKLCICFF